MAGTSPAMTVTNPWKGVLNPRDTPSVAQGGKRAEGIAAVDAVVHQEAAEEGAHLVHFHPEFIAPIQRLALPPVPISGPPTILLADFPDGFVTLPECVQRLGLEALPSRRYLAVENVAGLGG
jgi:hypothetical protein